MIGQFYGNCASLLPNNVLLMNPEAWRTLGAIMAVIGGFWGLACLCERERLREHRHLRNFFLSAILFVTGLLIILISMANIEQERKPRRPPVSPLQQKETFPEDRPSAGNFAELPTRFFISTIEKRVDEYSRAQRSSRS